MDDPLDNVVWAALTGPQAGFAQQHGRALRFRPDLSPFAALPADADADAWADLAALAGPGASLLLTGPDRVPPPGWTAQRWPGVQLVDEGLAVEPDPEAVRLGVSDVAEMRELVRRTDPGPFRVGTVTMGTYLGLRDGAGTLVAMAGERLRAPGWTEISAVCTDPDHRRRGLASRLIRAIGAGIRARGDRPFLHTAADNPARRLYGELGFVRRGDTHFTLHHVPS